MTGKRSTVDLGPMSLPVGDSVNFPESYLVKARALDINKLNDLMREGGHQNTVSIEPEEGLNLPNANLQQFSAALQDAKKVDALSEKIASVVPKTSSAVKGQAAAGIEIRIRETLLPETTLTVREADGKLSFDVWVGHADTRRWLVQKLPAVVQQVGQRLNRPLQITVFDPWCRQEAIAQCVWPSKVTV